MSRRGVVGARVITIGPGGRILPVIKPQQPRCAHQQAEPVTLSTGETVACVCIACLEGLRPDYIVSQRERAERAAHCRHDDTIDISAFGELPGTQAICAVCGARNPDREVS